MRKDEEAGKLMQACKNHQVLVLDDMGKENMTQFMTSQIYSLINHRYNRLLPTIFTSNYSIEKLTERLAPTKSDAITAKSITSRIQENCEFIELENANKPNKTANTNI